MQKCMKWATNVWSLMGSDHRGIVKLQHREACITHIYVFKILSIVLLHRNVKQNLSSLRYGAYFLLLFSVY